MFIAQPIRTVNGLILEQCHEGQPRFRRLGAFKIEKEEEVERFWKVCWEFVGPESWQKRMIASTRPIQNKEDGKVEKLQVTQHQIYLE